MPSFTTNQKCLNTHILKYKIINFRQIIHPLLFKFKCGTQTLKIINLYAHLGGVLHVYLWKQITFFTSYQNNMSECFIGYLCMQQLYATSVIPIIHYEDNLKMDTIQNIQKEQLDFFNVFINPNRLLEQAMLHDEILIITIIINLYLSH